jgi:hypothetical protein
MTATKTMLITGASTGIGVARSADKLAKLVDELGGPDNAIAVQCDVTSYEQQQAMVEQTLKAFGRIDAAFANAGIGSKGFGTEQGDPENWRDMILRRHSDSQGVPRRTQEESRAFSDHEFTLGTHHAERLDLWGDQMGRYRLWLQSARGVGWHRGSRHADRAGHGRYAVF